MKVYNATRRQIYATLRKIISQHPFKLYQMKKELKIVFSPRCLEYQQPGHPESPNRVVETYRFLKEKNFEFTEPAPCDENDILSVHTKTLLEKVKTGKFFDADTPNLPNIFYYAKLSAGGAMQAARLALTGQPAFSLMRPPGHHAGKNELGGFCYFNNLAIAIESVIKKAKRIAIVDIDAHHGQGTEEIFFDRTDVLYLSLHQVGIYPGTGLTSYKNCLNFPLLPGTGPEEYLTKLDQGLREVKKFKAKLIAVSAGFDTYKNDPLVSLNLELETYLEIGQKLAKLKLPLFAVLEGGYSQDLHLCIYNFCLGISK